MSITKLKTDNVITYANSKHNLSMTVQFNTYLDLMSIGSIWYVPSGVGADSSATSNNLFCSGSSVANGYIIGNNGSSGSCTVNTFRFVMRMCNKNSGSWSDQYTFQPVYKSSGGAVTDFGSTFATTHLPSYYGYATFVTPWLSFPASSGTGYAIGLKMTAFNNINITNSYLPNLRIGNTVIQYSYQ
jgi:hypothetical protein